MSSSEEDKIRDLIFEVFGEIKPRGEDHFRATISICKGTNRIATATGTILEILNLLPDVPDGYYLLEYYKDYAYQEVVSEKHFDCLCKKRGGLNITESIYCNWLANALIKGAKTGKYMDSFFIVAYWSLLVSGRLGHIPDLDSFSKWSTDFFESGKWKRIVNLNEQKGKSGVYAMLLDKYGLCYIGQAEDIRKRILAHWRVDKMGTLGIDLFRAKDTTRIYVINTPHMSSIEYNAVSQIPTMNRLNVLHGGTIDYHIKTGQPLLFDDSDIRKPWAIKYGDFQNMAPQYYEKFVVDME